MNFCSVQKRWLNYHRFPLSIALHKALLPFLLATEQFKSINWDNANRRVETIWCYNRSIKINETQRNWITTTTLKTHLIAVAQWHLQNTNEHSFLGQRSLLDYHETNEIENKCTISSQTKSKCVAQTFHTWTVYSIEKYTAKHKIPFRMQ